MQEQVTTTIKLRRMAAGLSRAQACRLANCYAPDYSRLEAGSMKAWPALRKRVAAALGTLERDLFDSGGWPLEADRSLADKSA